jgi:2-dehydro-3-deoxyglucarate aldolase/4-hydroxy-2-oxoheptanedioate aldolase
MKPNKLKQVQAEGRIPVGHMVWEFSTRGIAKILDSAGLDFVLIDMEHSCIEIERVADLIAWFKATPIAPFVRVPQCMYHFMARVMDAGALGVMIANVETAEQARSVVEAIKYAPLGKRGVGLGTSHTDFVVPDPVKYFEESNRNTTFICQIESPTGVSNLEAIASTEGVDILWVGHFDLSQAMGIPGEFHNPRFLDALRKVIETARKHGKFAGIQPGNIEQAQEWLEIGFNVISWSADSAVYRRALGEDVTRLRERLTG